MNRKLNKSRTICFLGFSHIIYDSRIYHKMIGTLKKSYKIIEVAEGDKDEIIQEDNLIIYSLSKKNGRLRYLWNFIKRSFSVKADIFVANEVESFPLVLLIKLFRRKKIVFDCHEFYGTYLKIPQPLYFKIYLWFFLGLRIFGTRFFNGVIVVTIHMENIYRKFSSKVMLIYNFPRRGIFNEVVVPLNIRKEFENKNLLIYQGGIKESRGLFQYLKIIKELKEKNFYLLVIGSGKITAKCQNYITENHLQNCFKHINFIEYDKLFAYTRLAKIGLNFLSSTFNNNYGIQNKMFEYMENNVPVLGTDNVFSMRKFVQQEGTGELVSFNDTKMAVRMINKIMKNYNYYQKNCQKVMMKYNWEKQEPALFDFYANI